MARSANPLKYGKCMANGCQKRYGLWSAKITEALLIILFQVIQGGRATTVTMRQKGLCPDSPQSNRSNGARPKDQKGAKDPSGLNNRKSPESSEAYGTGSTTGSEATTEESHPQQVQPLALLFFCLKSRRIMLSVFLPAN